MPPLSTNSNYSTGSEEHFVLHPGITIDTVSAVCGLRSDFHKSPTMRGLSEKREQSSVPLRGRSIK